MNKNQSKFVLKYLAYKGSGVPTDFKWGWGVATVIYWQATKCPKITDKSKLLSTSYRITNCLGKVGVWQPAPPTSARPCTRFFIL